MNGSNKGKDQLLDANGQAQEPDMELGNTRQVGEPEGIQLPPIARRRAEGFEEIVDVDGSAEDHTIRSMNEENKMETICQDRDAQLQRDDSQHLPLVANGHSNVDPVTTDQVINSIDEQLKVVGDSPIEPSRQQMRKIAPDISGQASDKRPTPNKMRKSLSIKLKGDSDTDELSPDSEDSADSDFLKSGMGKTLYLDQGQDQNMFEKLVKVTNIRNDKGELDVSMEESMKDVIHASLTYDNRDIITIEKETDQEAFIRSYILDEDLAEQELHQQNMQTQQISENTSVKSMKSDLRKKCKWSIPIMDKEFLKVDQITQNDDGSKFIICFQDNGKFYIKMVDKDGKILVDDFYLNDQLGIDDKSKGIKVCTTPLIVSSQFLDDDETIFICLYHKKKKMQHHFIFNYDTKGIKTKGFHVFKQQSHSSEMNYPVAAFHVEPVAKKDKFYSFYRQGMIVEIDYSQGSFEDTSKDVKLMPREIDQIFFSKLKIDPDNSKSEEFKFFICLYNCQICFYTWNSQAEIYKYESIKNDEGSMNVIQMTYTSGDTRFQLIQEKKIQIYKLVVMDGKFRPVLENTMFNYMNCSQLLLSKNGDFAVSFKYDQNNLYIYERKYLHSFSVKIDGKDYEGTIARTLKDGHFVLAHHRYVKIYNSKKKQKAKIKIDKLKEDEEVVSMELSKDDKRLGVAIGKRIEGDDETITCIIIFALNKVKVDGKKKVLQIDEMARTNTLFDKNTSIEFEFAANNVDEIILFSKDSIMRFNYKRDAENSGHRKSITKQMVKLQGLDSQPDFVSFNNEQTHAMVASENGLVYVSLCDKNQTNINLGKKESIEDIKSVIYDKQGSTFFILANKKNDQIGFFLMSFNELTQEVTTHINWEHKLPIDDADMSMMNSWNNICSKEDSKMSAHSHTADFDPHNDYHRHVVCSFKTQYINTYNIFVINVDSGQFEFWHESYALFEAEQTGFHCADDDFMILNRFGMFLVTLKADQKEARKVRASDNQKQKLHSMGSLQYLKVHHSNHIRIMDAGEDTLIGIQDQYTDNLGKTKFIDLYRIKLFKQTLRELLFIQSLFSSPSEQDVYDFIIEQPSTSHFYEPCFELDKRSIVTYLIRQQKAVNYLLGDENKKFFNIMYPIFYNNNDGQSAIDIALSNNLVRPICKVIDYIVKYQNSPVFANLFRKNFIQLLHRSIPVTHVLNSRIFIESIDHAAWPTQAEDNMTIIKPYNESDIHMQQQYEHIFPKQAEKDIPIMEEMAASTINLMKDMHLSMKRSSAKLKDSNKVLYKIKYSINRLPTFSSKDEYLIDALLETNELEIFATKAVIDFSNYHWENYGKYPIMAGLIFHTIFIGLQIVYIDQVYQQKLPDEETKYLIQLMLIPLVFAAVYDFKQFLSCPMVYFTTTRNKVDFSHLVTGFTNLFLQYFIGHEEVYQKAIFIVVICLSLYKIFNFMRVFKRLSYIVTMLGQVIFDLMYFFIFYCVLILMMAQIMSICESSMADISMDYPKMSYFGQRIINSMRLSLGSFTIGSKGVNTLSEEELGMFFAVRTVCVWLANMIFMKFLIGEVMKTFNAVRSTIDIQIEKQRLALIQEAQDVLGRRTENKEWFPKYLVVREQET